MYIMHFPYTSCNLFHFRCLWLWLKHILIISIRDVAKHCDYDISTSPLHESNESISRESTWETSFCQTSWNPLNHCKHTNHYLLQIFISIIKKYIESCHTLIWMTIPKSWYPFRFEKSKHCEFALDVTFSKATELWISTLDQYMYIGYSIWGKVNAAYTIRWTLDTG